MTAPSPFDPPAGEALAGLELPNPQPAAGTRCFEFSCRGDRGRLEIHEPSEAPGPVLLLQPSPVATGSPDAPGDLQVWLSAGIRVASLTLPLFGTRRSPKMSAMLEQAVADSAAGKAPSQNGRILWQEFTRQSVMELRRAIDLLEELRDGRPSRVAFAGAGLAASVGAIFCAVDPRPVAAFLAAPVRHGPEGADPSPHLDALASRAVRVLDEDGGDLLDAAWPFLSPHLADS